MTRQCEQKSTPSKEVEAPARSTRTRIRALNPESRRLPLVHPLARLPCHMAHLQLRARHRHRHHPRRRPYPNRTRPPCTCHAPTTHTTTQAAPNDRHPLSEGLRPGTGMQDYLSQATLAASEPRRSPGASASTPKHAASEGTQPPSPIDALRPLEPPQLPASLSSGGVEGGDSILSPQHGREARDAIPSIRVEHHERNGPCSRVELVVTCQAPSRHPGLSCLTLVPMQFE